MLDRLTAANADCGSKSMRQSEVEDRYAELTMALSRLQSNVPFEAREHCSDIQARAADLYEALITKVRLLETVLENSPDHLQQGQGWPINVYQSSSGARVQINARDGN